MRLLALVNDPQHVCARYRLEAFRAHWESQGHRLDYLSWPKSFTSRFLLSSAFRTADVVIVQRRLLPAWQLWCLRRRARVLCFDFDDAVFLRDSFHPRGLHSRRLLGRFRRMVRWSDHVVAGNDFLAEAAARWTERHKIAVVPTCVDPAKYPLASHAPDGPVRLVWIGSASTLAGLRLMAESLENLGKKMDRLQLRLVCDRSMKMDHLSVDFRPWSEAAEARELASADIGISWIPDDDWSRGKCGLKVLQYMAAGLPVVANAVGVHRRMIDEGRTGFVAETPDRWEEAVLRLTADADLRRRLGQAGRRKVENEYATERGAAAWLELLTRSVPSERRRSA